MTLLGRFQRREGRRSLGRWIPRAVPHLTKHSGRRRDIKKMGMSYSSFSSPGWTSTMEASGANHHPTVSSPPGDDFSRRQGQHEPKNNTGDSVTFPSGNQIGKLFINPATISVLRQAVLEHLGSTSSKTSTVMDLAIALGGNDGCKSKYAMAVRDQNTIMGFVNGMWTAVSGHLPDHWSWARQDKQTMERRYEWVNAFERLEKRPLSREKEVSSWEEAKEALEDILVYDVCSSPIDGQAGHGDMVIEAASSEAIRDKHAKKLDAELSLIQDSVDTMSVANSKWRQIASIQVPKKLGEMSNDDIGRNDVEDDIAALVQEQSIDKADLYFNARIQSAEEYAQALRESSSATKKLEERMKEAEAKKRASSLMRSLNDEELDLVRSAVFGYGGGDDIVAQCGSDSVQRSSIQTLRPGAWLNDEVIHYFYLMLANRDAEMCEKDPSRQRSHFFKSFFITKLLNEGNTAVDGKYEYRNVKRWSKNVPGKDIFGLNKIIFPINMGGMHWICAAIFMKEKRIEIFDSMGSAGHRYLQALFQYLQDEHEDKKKTPLPDADKWELVPTRDTTPQQRNGNDCGVFTCMFADFVSKDCPLVFSQEHINQCRERIALSILNGKAIM